MSIWHTRPSSKLDKGVSLKLWWCVSGEYYMIQLLNLFTVADSHYESS